MRVVSIVGARPQFIKAAPLLKALSVEHDSVLVHTGQHYDDSLSRIFFDELAIPEPSHHLGVGSGLQGAQTAAMLMALEPVLEQTAADWVIVYGDTNTTLAGAVVAAKSKAKLAHVEAGLRSYNRRMPEEQNRIVVDHLSQLLLCPSGLAAANLAREGIVDGVRVVGDLMAESCLASVERARAASTVMTRLGLRSKGFLLATVHRAENTDDHRRLSQIFKGLEQTGEDVVVPLHPRTRRAVGEAGISAPPRVRLIEPVGYLDMLRLQSEARVVLTDSGGVQREAYWLGVPCIILRDETEWEETLGPGANALAGTDPSRIAALAGAAGMPSRPPVVDLAPPPSTRIIEALKGHA